MSARYLPASRAPLRLGWYLIYCTNALPASLYGVRTYSALSAVLGRHFWCTKNPLDGFLQTKHISGYDIWLLQLTHNNNPSVSHNTQTSVEISPNRDSMSLISSCCESYVVNHEYVICNDVFITDILLQKKNLDNKIVR